MPFSPIRDDLRFQPCWVMNAQSVGPGTITLDRPGEANRFHVITGIIVSYNQTMIGGAWSLQEFSPTVTKLQSFLSRQSVTLLDYPISLGVGKGARVLAEKRYTGLITRVSYMGITLDRSETLI